MSSPKAEIPCAGCKQPEHCTGTYPEDDPHKPGEIRGCFKAKSETLVVTTVRGRERTGTAVRANPVWEKGRITESRPGGFEMPFLDPKTGKAMTQKRYAEGGRHLVEDAKRRRAQTP